MEERLPSDQAFRGLLPGRFGRALLLALPVVLALALGIAWLLARDRPVSSLASPVALPEGRAPAEAILDAGAIDGPDRSVVSPEPDEDGPLAPRETTDAERLSFRIHVLDEESGEPIAEASVSAAHGSWSIQAETDGEGACTLALPERVQSVRLLVEKPGFFHTRANYLTQELTIRLHRAVTLEGLVLAADTEEPLPHARILMTHGSCKGCEPTVAEADLLGRYELPGVPNRSAFTYFRVEAEGFPDQGESFQLRSGESRVTHDFRVQRGIAVEGRILDLVSGIAIPEAFVGDQPADPSGHFLVRVAPPKHGGEVELRFRAAGHCELWAHYSFERLRNREPLEVLLPASATVEGVVRDERGSPVPGARISLREDHLARAARTEDASGPLSDVPSDWLWNPTSFLSSSTDEAGRFAITGVLPWSRDWLVQALAPGFEPNRRPLEATPPAGGRAWLELGLTRAEASASVSGRVTLNGFGRTLEGKISWTAEGRSGEAHLFQGDYSFEVPPGPIELRVEVEGLPHPLTGDEGTLDLHPGEKAIRDFPLSLPSAPISGSVRMGGEPPPRITVVASCPLRGEGAGYWDRLHYRADTDAGGRYVVSVPDWERPYRVEMTHANETTGIEGVQAGGTDVDLDLSRRGSLLLRIVAPDSSAELPLHRFWLLWRRHGESEVHTLSTRGSVAPDQDGWYAFELPEGRVDLMLARQLPSSPYRPTSVEGVSILSGAEPTRVVLVPSPSLELVLTTPSGEPLPEGHSLFLVVEDPQEGSRWASHDHLGLEGLPRPIAFEEGRCTITGLAPSRLRLQAVPDDLALEPATIDLSPEGPRSVELRWRPR